jgi:Alpha adaptin AP2, C-terminal domain
VYQLENAYVLLFQVLGAGLGLLDGIDPNPDNFVCAGIVHSTLHQIGCLVRLEPNKQANVSMLLDYSHLRICIWIFELIPVIRPGSRPGKVDSS